MQNVFAGAVKRVIHFNALLIPCPNWFFICFVVTNDLSLLCDVTLF